MSSPTTDKPLPIKFSCENCKSLDGDFWSITPDRIFNEPSRQVRGNFQNLQSSGQCPLCGKINNIYWYRSNSH
jgi:hypothetical protein